MCQIVVTYITPTIKSNHGCGCQVYRNFITQEHINVSFCYVFVCDTQIGNYFITLSFVFSMFSVPYTNLVAKIENKKSSSYVLATE